MGSASSAVAAAALWKAYYYYGVLLPDLSAVSHLLVLGWTTKVTYFPDTFVPPRDCRRRSRVSPVHMVTSRGSLQSKRELS